MNGSGQVCEDFGFWLAEERPTEVEENIPTGGQPATCLTEHSGDSLGVKFNRGNELLQLIGVLGNSAMLRSAREPIHGAREASGGSRASQEAREILVFPDARDLVQPVAL